MHTSESDRVKLRDQRRAVTVVDPTPRHVGEMSAERPPPGRVWGGSATVYANLETVVDPPSWRES